MATTPALGSLSTADLAAKIRTKYPGSYDDKPDSVLVSAWLDKYPDYAQYLSTGTQQMMTPGQEPGQFQQSRGGPVINPAAAGQAPGKISADNPITPLPGESFDATMQRAIEAGRHTTEAQIAEEHKQNIRKAPVVLAAAPLAGFAQPAAFGAIGGAFAPTVASETVGTGILDAAGEEITREAVKYGPSVAMQVARWIAGNKIATAAMYEGARRAGIPLPNVIGWIMKAATQ